MEHPIRDESELIGLDLDRKLAIYSPWPDKRAWPTVVTLTDEQVERIRVHWRYIRANPHTPMGKWGALS